MSKKKAPARKAAAKVKAKTMKKAAPRKAAPRRAMAAMAAATPARRTSSATIFVYKVDGQTRVRTSPQLLSAGPGHIEWTVVNLSSDQPVDVDITWAKESPWGGAEPIMIKGGNYRRSLDNAKDGHYKYNVSCDGFTEDPEVEIPGN